jgi:hypothetical protein
MKTMKKVEIDERMYGLSKPTLEGDQYAIELIKRLDDACIKAISEMVKNKVDPETQVSVMMIGLERIVNGIVSCYSRKGDDGAEKFLMLSIAAHILAIAKLTHGDDAEIDRALVSAIVESNRGVVDRVYGNA